DWPLGLARYHRKPRWRDRGQFHVGQRNGIYDMAPDQVKPLHFLVVDDDPDSRSMIVDYLNGMGYTQVSVARDGAEALRVLEKTPSINFVISDWDMPMVNGLTLLQKVKSLPGRSQMPFLIVTSPVSDEAEKVVMAAENLVDGYLIKPFRSVLLQDK